MARHLQGVLKNPGVLSAGLAFAAGLLRAGGATRVSGLVLMTSGWTFLMSQKGATETAARRNAMAFSLHPKNESAREG